MLSVSYVDGKVGGTEVDVGDGVGVLVGTGVGVAMSDGAGVSIGAVGGGTLSEEDIGVSVSSGIDAPDGGPSLHATRVVTMRIANNPLSMAPRTRAQILSGNREHPKSRDAAFAQAVSSVFTEFHMGSNDSSCSRSHTPLDSLPLLLIPRSLLGLVCRCVRDGNAPPLARKSLIVL